MAIWTKHTNTNNTMNYRDLEPEAALAELQQEPAPRLLDVRTEPEHRSHRLPNSVLVPVQELAQRFCELDAQDNWFVYCEHGRRVARAAWLLRGQAGGALPNPHLRLSPEPDP